MTRTPYHTATHELVGTCGAILHVGTAGACFQAMTNIYGDAPVAALVKQGVKVRRL